MSCLEAVGEAPNPQPRKRVGVGMERSRGTPRESTQVTSKLRRIRLPNGVSRRGDEESEQEVDISHTSVE